MRANPKPWVAAEQIALYDLVDDVPKEPLYFIEAILIFGQEPVKVME